MMWSNKFKIFGDGTDKLILIDGDVGHIIPNVFLTSFDITYDSIKTNDMHGGIHIYPEMISSRLIFQAGETETISGKDLADLYDPVMQKSVMELMKAVNKKLRTRV